MTLLYALTKAIYFPGTFLKAFWEHLACRIFGVPIYDADAYLSRSTLSGHVSMIPSESAAKSFFVCLVPGVANLLIGFPAFAGGILTLGFMGVDVIDPMSGQFCPMFVVYVLLYLFGASCLCSVFPYIPDVLHIWQMYFGKESRVSAVRKAAVLLPAGVMTLGAYLERYCITFFATLALLIYWIMT